MFTQWWRRRKASELFDRLLLRWWWLGSPKDPAIHTPLHHAALTLRKTLLQQRDTALPQAMDEGRHVLKTTLRKSFFIWLRDQCGGLTIALTLALLIRFCWFEHYQVPTGSMRPTLYEKDFVLVNKTAYGINPIFGSTPNFFSPKLLKRNHVVVFTSQGLQIPDPYIDYLGLFRGYKTYVKRVIAKGGDVVYFYGGRAWIIDHNGYLRYDTLKFSDQQHLETVPLFDFAGFLQAAPGRKDHNYASTFLKKAYAQWNIREGQWHITKGTWRGTDQRHAKMPWGGQNLWGVENYAQVRLLTPKQLVFSKASRSQLPQATFYLELSYAPTMEHMPFTEMDGTTPLYLKKMVIPLFEDGLQRLKEGLFTSRFVVKNGLVYPYHYLKHPLRSAASMDKVPDGIYEFQKGKAYQITSTSHRIPLATTHPLYDNYLFPVLFNLGVNWDERYLPAPSFSLSPHRYAYYRFGAFYVMNTMVYDKEHPRFQEYLQHHIELEKDIQGYLSFKDQPLPQLEEHRRQFIVEKGFRVPKNHFLAFGDNYADSADSRVFGPVSYNAIRGTPFCILWPPSSATFSFKAPTTLIPSPYTIFVSIFAILGYLLYRLARRQIVQRCWKELIKEMPST